MPMILLTILALSTFLVRFIPRCFRKNAIVSDTYYHLYCAELIRHGNFRLPATLPSVMLKNEYTYPFGYHLLLALFPASIRDWAERLTAPLCDTFNCLVVYQASAWFLRRGQQPKAELVALAVAGLYSFSPALLRVGSGPRAFNGSARVLGQTLYLVHILSAYLAWTQLSLAWAGLSTLAGATLLFTATFSTQVFLLFGIGFTALVHPTYLLLMVACLLVSTLLTAGRVLHVLRGRIAHSTLYFTHLQEIFLYPHLVTFRMYLQSVRSALHLLFSGRLEEFITWYFHCNHYVHLFFTVFPQFVFLFFLAPWRLLGNADARFLLVWAGSGLLWALLTKQKGLLFMGEGERYLEATMLPSLLLFTLGAWISAHWLLLGFAIYFAVATLYILKDYLESYRQLHENYTRSEDVFVLLRELPPGALLPLGNIYWQAIHRAPNPVLTSAMLDTRLLPCEEFLYVYGNYPYPGGDFQGITDRYGVQYVLAERAGLNHYLNTFIDDPQQFRDAFMLLQEKGDLMLFGRKDTLQHLATITQDALARFDYPKGLAGLDTLRRFFPDDPELKNNRTLALERIQTPPRALPVPPAPNLSTGTSLVQQRLGLLYELDTHTQTWEGQLAEFCHTLTPTDTATLLLVFESVPVEPALHDVIHQRLLDLECMEPLGPTSKVLLVNEPEDLLQHIKRCPWIQWHPAALVAGAPVGSQVAEAFLAEPRWESQAWVTLVQDFLTLFTSEDPVALVLLVDPHHPWGVSLAEAEQAVLGIMVATGLVAYPPVLLLDQVAELVDTLRDFPVISWAPGEAAYHPDCTGPLGIKFREGRARPIG